MGFKKIRYNAGENIVETRIKDETGREIGKWVVMMSNFPEAYKIIKKKFGLRENKDFDWAL